MKKLVFLLVITIAIMQMRGSEPYILYISPHPDDELGGAYTFYHMTGEKHILVVTDSVWTGYEPLEDYQIRRDETLCAASVLEIPQKNVHFVGIKEEELDEMTVEELAEVLRPYLKRADIIFMPSKSDARWHPHHQKVRDAVLQSIEGKRIIRYEYNIYWDLLSGVLTNLGHDVYELKSQMFACYVSQHRVISSMPEHYLPDPTLLIHAEACSKVD